MLKKYLKKYNGLIVLSFLLVLIQAMATLYQPTLISNVINALSSVDALGNSNIDQNVINENGIMLIVVGVVGLIAGMLNTFISANVAQKTGANIRSGIFNKVQELSYGDVEKFTTSKLVVRMTNDVTQVQTLLMMGMQVMIRIPILFIGAFIMAVIALPKLWWTIIVYIIIVLIVLMFLMRRIGPSFGRLQGGIDQVNTVVKENMDGVRVVKSFVTEDKEEAKFQEKVDGITENLLKIGKTFSITIPTFMFVANIMIAVSIYFVSIWALDDPALIGDLISYTTYLMQIMFALIMGGFMLMSVGRATVSIKRINEVLTTETSMTYGNEQVQKGSTITFENVSFMYPNAEEETLKNINFSVNAGEKVGIVGATGSGKTTLVNLISRLYDVTDGAIKIADKDIKEYDKTSLNDNVSIVLQKALLLSGTIRDNILQGNKNANDEEIMEAAKKAQSYEFITKKDGTLDGEVLQRGNNFSGGQKQRLSITRGLVKNPQILILDDSTSALDAKSEKLVKDVINNELEDTTTIIVAQKISSVIDTDKIIVLNDGTIDAIGTHNELIEASMVYREIYETQKGKGVVANG